MLFIVLLEIFFCLQRKNKAKSSCSPTSFIPISLFVAPAPVHIYMNRSIYMSVSSCIYSTWLLTYFLFRLHPGSSYSQSRFCSGQNISQSVRVYITRLLTCFVTDLFSFFRRPPFIICHLLHLGYPDTYGILCPFVSAPIHHLRFPRKSVFVCKVTEQGHCTRSVSLSSVKFDGNFPQSQITAFHKISSLISCWPVLSFSVQNGT